MASVLTLDKDSAAVGWVRARTDVLGTARFQVVLMALGCNTALLCRPSSAAQEHKSCF